MEGKQPFDSVSDFVGGVKTLDGTTPGSTYTTLGQTSFDTYAASGFAAFVTVQSTPGGTSPTVDVKLQHSPDLINWVDLSAFTQITKTGTYPQSFALNVPGPGTSDPKTWARYVRFQYKVGGTTPEWVITGQIIMRG